MEAVIGLLLMILGVSHGEETYCDGRQDGAQCYGALGGTVVLQLMDSASEIFRYQWSNKTTVILYGRKNQIVSNEIENRSSFTPSDGTFRISKLSRSDEGEYTLEIYDSDGRITEQRTLQLTIQAPVSSVLLVSECLSQGEMRVSCSSEGGDSPQYSWTLDGHTLTDAELLSGNTETTNITLKQHVSGQLVCSVRNKVSSVSKEITISTCGFIFINCILPNATHISQWVFAANNTLCIDPTTAPTTTAETVDHSLLICGVRAAVVILVLIGICVFFAWKKKKYKMAAGSGVRCVETYCDGRQDGAQCYGALGGTVVLQLMDSTSEIFSYQWSTKTTTILNGRKNQIVSNEIENRSSFTPSDGTFRVSKLSRSDEGEYNLVNYDSNGQRSEQRTLQLTIQAPVSSVLLVSECLSQGEMRVSCSSEGGDSPQYSWTLDGHTLTDAELLSGNTETTNITLKQHVSGQLVCSVRNKVSSVSKEITISTCGFIFINCTLPNATHISQWVFAANNTLCIEPTTAPTTTTETVGVETSCDGRQDGAQCYGALGGTVVLRLMDSASEIFRYQWSTKTTVILNGRKNQIASNEIENRSSFTPSDGTFRVSKLSRSDEGEYTLEIYDSNGRRSEQRILQLTIQAPVSSVLLVSECLSQGEMRVSCSSEGGDSPQYSWTLDGRTLTDAELLSGNTETTNITLKQHVSGQLVCSVRNKVSRISSGFIFSECISTSTEDHSLLICGVRAAVVILVLIGIFVFFAWKKKKYKMAAGSGVRYKRGHEENSVMMVEVRSSASELYCNL
ncbi:hypothetical protein ABVT39_022982 [Epinephelus coioides]